MTQHPNAIDIRIGDTFISKRSNNMEDQENTENLNSVSHLQRIESERQRNKQLVNDLGYDAAKFLEQDKALIAGNQKEQRKSWAKEAYKPASGMMTRDLVNGQVYRCRISGLNMLVTLTNTGPRALYFHDGFKVCDVKNYQLIEV